MKLIDMHVHSTFSDGTCTPTEIVKLAEEKKVSAFVLTDHDTVAGVEEAMEAAKNSPVRVLPGIEISAVYKNKDIHILGYHIDIYNEEFLNRLDTYQRERDFRNGEMIRLLAEQGFDISMEQIKQKFPNAALTRAHLARYLLDHGYVESINEAFQKYVGEGCPCYLPKDGISAEEALECIRIAGGRPVLAHPFLYRIPWEEVKELVAYMAEIGIEGLEVLYYKHTLEEKEKLGRLANQYKLFITGGSDFHGANKPTEIGTGKGNLRVPECLLRNIEEQPDRYVGAVVHKFAV